MSNNVQISASEKKAIKALAASIKDPARKQKAILLLKKAVKVQESRRHMRTKQKLLGRQMQQGASR